RTCAGARSPRRWPSTIRCLRSLRSSICARSSHDVLIGGDRQVGHPLPGEALPHPLPAGGAEAAPKLLVVEQPPESGAQRIDIARLDQQPSLVVDDQVDEPADGGGDDRAAVRNRLGPDDAEALAM